MAEADDLWTSVTERFSAVYLRNLTNPQDGATTSITTAKGTRAATDVIANFAAKGITYLNTTATHLNVAVDGVIAKLQMRTGQHEWAWKRHQEYMDALDALRLVTANDRMTPVSNSTLDTTDEVVGAKPDMDPARFSNYQPGAPSGGGLEDD